MTGEAIIIVDDEPSMVALLSTFLKLKGYQITSAHNGADALALIEKQPPRLVLLDLMLPDISGLEICRRLRASPDQAQLPVLFLSARTDQTSIEQANQAGGNGYLIKPVKFPDLLAEIERLLGSQ